MTITLQRVLRTALLLFASPILLSSQAVMTQPSYLPKQSIREFEGRYQYRDGLTLFMVSSGDQLTAIIGDSKYLLSPVSNDTFKNPAGDSIPFLRNSDGRVIAFKEGEDQFSRLSSSVPDAARRLFYPRPTGPTGKPDIYRYTPPLSLRDGIQVGRAGSSTLPVDVAEQLVNGVIQQKYADVHSLLIYQKGALVLEEYFYGFDREQPHAMISFTKSVISLLVGAAVDRGMLRPDQPVLELLGYPTFQHPDPRKAQITVTDLLSNQSGLACNEYDRNSPGNEAHLFKTEDWAKAFADLPMLSEPGKTAHYCSGGFFAAGRIVERVSGKPLPQFADQVLFAPLGVPKSNWRWSFALNNREQTSFGQIYLRPRDMLKLGILIQNRGYWEGKQVISSSWVDSATGIRSHIDDSDYGLGIWHRWYNVKTATGDRRVETIMLSGNGGQKVYLVPSFDLIVVSTGNAFFVESPVNEIMARVILPALIRSDHK